MQIVLVGQAQQMTVSLLLLEDTLANPSREHFHSNCYTLCQLIDDMHVSSTLLMNITNIAQAYGKPDSCDPRFVDPN